MPKLSPSALRSRLAFDAKVLGGLSSPTVGNISGYTSASNARARRAASDSERDTGQVVLYDVDFTFPMLSGRGKRLERATARFDLLAGGNYPFTPPNVQFITSSPWCPHVHSPTGSVCLGSAWPDARGQMLLAQLVVHVMRLVNFDEPRRNSDTFSADALAFWRDELRWAPLNPGLNYPILPADITHGVAKPGSTFRAVGNAPAFRPDDSTRLRIVDKPSSPAGCSFNPIGRTT